MSDKKRIRNTIVPPIGQKPCIRCLTDQLDDDTAHRIIADYKADTAKGDEAGEELYRQRLQTCLDCKYLNKGVCLKSGYYVEARMYRKTGVCPLKLF